VQKRQFQTANLNLLEVDFKLEFFLKIKILQVMFQNVLMELKYGGKKKTVFFFYNIF
jgi:hypothetical protein